jgi:hypothetical protein
MADRYHRDSLFNDTQRDQLGFSPQAVAQSALSRYFLPITNMYQQWLFYRGFGASEVERAYFDLSVQSGFQTIAEVLTRPLRGSYVREGDRFEWVSYDESPNADLVVPRTQGRIEFSQYDFSHGYYVSKRVVELGAYYERLAALIALTSSDARVLGVGADATADSLRYSLPYYLVFEEPINRLFGAIVRGDSAAFAPSVINGGELVYPSYFAPAATPEGTPLVSPVSFSTQLNTMVYGMAALSVNFDLGFIHRGQVALVGSGEIIAPAAGFQEMTYEDPFSGRQYVAWRSEADPDDTTWYAAEAIETLNEMRAQWESMPESPDRTSLEYDMQERTAQLELLRSAYRLFGSAL